MAGLQGIIQNYLNRRENYYGGSGVVDINNMDSNALWAFVITYLLIYILLLIIGKFLWNSFLVDMFSFVRPINSVWHILALSILVKLVIY